MGKASRQRPERLAEKLLQIRNVLGLSQSQMLNRLGIGEESYRNYISNFETGKREPPLLVILSYAQCVNLSTDYLINDALELPSKLPVPKRKRTP